MKSAVNNNIVRTKQGFTLIELMMAMALFSLVILVVYGFLNYSFDFLHTHNQDQVSSFTMRKVISRMAEERNKWGNIYLETVDLGGGTTAAAIRVETSGTDLMLPAPGAGLFYSPVPNAAYLFSYDAGNKVLLQQGEVFAQGVEAAAVQQRENVIIVEFSIAIADSTALEQGAVSLPVRMNPWAIGG